MARIAGVIPLIGVEGRVTGSQAGHIRLQVVPILTGLAPNTRIEDLTSEAEEIDKTFLALSIDCIFVEAIRTGTYTHLQMLELQCTVRPTGGTILRILAIAFFTGLIAFPAQIVYIVGIVARAARPDTGIREHIDNFIIGGTADTVPIIEV